MVRVAVGERPLERVPAVLGRAGHDVAEVVGARRPQHPRAAQQPAQPRQPRRLAEELAPHADDEPKPVRPFGDEVGQRLGHVPRVVGVAGQGERLLELVEDDEQRPVVGPQRRGERGRRRRGLVAGLQRREQRLRRAVAGAQRHDPPAVQPGEATLPYGVHEARLQQRGLAAAGVADDADGRLGAEDAEQLGDLGAAAEEQVGVALGEARQAAVRRHELERRALLRAAERAGPRPQFEEGPRPVGLGRVGGERFFRRLPGGEGAVERGGGGRAVFGVERKRAGDDGGEVAAARAEELLRDAAEPAAAAGLPGLAHLQKGEPRGAGPAPLGEFPRGRLGGCAVGGAQQHAGAVAVGEEVEHVVGAGERRLQADAGGAGERREVRRFRREAGERGDSVRADEGDFGTRLEGEAQRLEPAGGVERGHVAADRLRRRDEDARPVAEGERPRRAAAEDADEPYRVLLPAAEQEPVVVRLAEEAVGEVADAVGGGVDEQPHGAVGLLGAGEDVGPLLGVLGLSEQRGEQVFAELAGGVGRQLGPLGEVRHPLGEARRQFGEDVALGVAEVFGEQLGAELVAVLRHGEADVVRGGHGRASGGEARYGGEPTAVRRRVRRVRNDTRRLTAVGSPTVTPSSRQVAVAPQGRRAARSSARRSARPSTPPARPRPGALPPPSRRGSSTAPTTARRSAH